MKLFLFIITCLLTNNAIAWDGFDQDGQPIEIDYSQSLSEGNAINVYYYDTQQTREVVIESIDDPEHPSEIEAYDENLEEHIIYNFE